MLLKEREYIFIITFKMCFKILKLLDIHLEILKIDKIEHIKTL